MGVRIADMPKIIPGLKEKLLEVSASIIEENGYGALSMKELAQKSGIAVGTIYNYFPDKNALLGAIVVQDWENLEKKLEGELASLSSLEEGIKLLYKSFLSFSQAHQNLFAFFSHSSTQAYDASYRNFVEKASSLLEKLLARFGQGPTHCDCRMAASLFSLAIHYPDIPYPEIQEAVKKLL